MGISTQRLEAHKLEYEARYQNYRQSWPRHLYRHEPIQNAIKILQNGFLLSRNAAVQNDLIGLDIAPEEIINSSDAAHDYARLYFRPRNPTQYHIEGIRKPADYYGDKHAGFTMMLMFDAASVLTQDSTKFSCGNMQSHNTSVFDDDVGFDQLNFDYIYHDSAQHESEITRQRCAEVLPQSGLSLANTLKYIVVRTDADLATMKHCLVISGLHQYLPMVRKTTGSGIFFNRYTAVDHIDTAPNRVIFKLAATSSIGQIQTQIQILELASRNVMFSINAGLDGNKRYYLEHNLGAGDYLVNYSLEGVFAHESQITLT
jgi:hypothetical protein